MSMKNFGEKYHFIEYCNTVIMFISQKKFTHNAS